MDDLGRADRGQIAVALVGQHEGLRPNAPDAGRDGRGAPVRGLHEVDVEVVIGEDGATDGRDRDGVGRQVELGHDFGEQPVDDAVAAPGAVVGGSVDQDVGPVVDQAGGRSSRRDPAGGVESHRRPPRRALS